MKSTATKRVWRTGAPPHVGWWNASCCRDHLAWRWWNGKRWSCVAYTHSPIERVRRNATVDFTRQGHVVWNDYWPEGARVVRLDITHARRQRVVDLALVLSAKNPTWPAHRVWAEAKQAWWAEGGFA